MAASSSSELPPTTKESSRFEKICEAARLQDQRQLTAAIGTGSIDECKISGPRYSAVTQVAKEGDELAVEFLLKHGASIHFAVHGAALGLHKELADKLIKRGAYSSCAALGAAQTEDQNYLNSLVVDCDSSLFGFIGAAFAGKSQYLEDLPRHCFKEEADEATIKGYGRRGDVANVEKLLIAGVRITPAAVGYALEGHKTEANQLIRRGAFPLSTLFGAIEGGHFEYADELIKTYKLDPKSPLSLFHAVVSGYQHYAELLLIRGANLQQSANYFVKVGYEHLFAQFLLLAWVHGNQQAYEKLSILSSTKEFKNLPPLEIAYQFKQLPIMLKLLSEAIRAKDESLIKRGFDELLAHFPYMQGAELLSAAILEKQAPLIYYCVNNGYLDLKEWPKGNTPLHLAAQSNDAFFTTYFLKQRKEWLHQKNDAERTPLEEAISLGHSKSIKRLLPYSSFTLAPSSGTPSQGLLVFSEIGNKKRAFLTKVEAKRKELEKSKLTRTLATKITALKHFEATLQDKATLAIPLFYIIFEWKKNHPEYYQVLCTKRHKADFLKTPSTQRLFDDVTNRKLKKSHYQDFVASQSLPASSSSHPAQDLLDAEDPESPFKTTYRSSSN